MAQADSVRSSTRQLITGGSINQSTNLPAVTANRSDRGSFIGGLGARCPMAEDKAALPLRPRQKRPTGIQPVGLFKWRWYEVNTGQVPTGSNFEALSYLWRLLKNILFGVRRLLSRKRHSPFRARENTIEKMPSRQLVRSSRPRERLK
jgi:hypothetical protein